ncbi:hypothetical protein CQA53_10085, partial [Helicobacter didelphidarum]
MQNHIISHNDITSLTKDSPIALLKALYQCESYIALDSNNNPTLDDNNAIKTFGYKSSFYLSFIANKDSLSDKYLNARKALYKSIMQIKEERQSEIERALEEHKAKQQELERALQKLDSKERLQRIQEIQKEQEREFKERQREMEREQRQARFSKFNTANNKSKESLNSIDSYLYYSRNNNSNHLILESNDKSIKIIFLDKLDSKTSSSNNAYNASSNNTSSLKEALASWQSTHNTSNNTSNHTINQSNNISLSNLLYLHNNKIDIFTKNGSEIDI